MAVGGTDHCWVGEGVGGGQKVIMLKSEKEGSGRLK